MVNRVSEETLVVLRKISVTTEGEKFIGWLETILSDNEALMPYVEDEVNMRWVQGECRILREILDLIRNADKRMDMLYGDKKIQKAIIAGRHPQ